MKNIGSIIVKVFTVGFGLFMVVTGWNLWMSSTKEWSQAQAVVTASSINVGDDTTSESYDITYKYQVNGVEYTDTMTSSTNYNPGDTLTVSFDPAAPESSYTSRGEANFMGAGVLMFGLFCIGSVIWGEWKARKGAAEMAESVTPSDSTQGGA